ncbi:MULTISPECIES: glycosyltransferase family 32 protein [Myroides]|uniref:Glycosyl transferase n=1 Tax=Myroides albus TaxID=2562892 RepID=A0A6I3LQN0_9FLAO|nr:MULTISPECIES: glycosyltransferase [Myroides]MTG98462.1 glycosyl transferase [Myroides albus]MVX34435.1 glycosyl transferase [Myroides sp. LoEW2-1]UVD78219.1 glycosyl transferase [Myroides albus]
MIPKIIHLCWFGKKPYSDKVQMCLNSFHKYLPEYEIMFWNEDNFDVTELKFVQEAYAEKKYAFVSDVCRLHALKLHGGVYFDTDVEVLQELDSFLDFSFFCGFESDKLLSTAVIGAVPNHPIINELLDFYSNKTFYRKYHPYKKYYTTPNTIHVTKKIKEKGLVLEDRMQRLANNVAIFPTSYFSPICTKTGVCHLTDNTFTIHHFTGSWQGGKNRKEWIKSFFGL